MIRFLFRFVVLLIAAVAVTAGIGVLVSPAQRAIQRAWRADAPGERKWRCGCAILSIPAAERAKANPLPANAENLREGLEHFADHCAMCHGNNGSGDTPIGRGLYPKPPVLRDARTQSLSDGELFSIIQNGIRFTGMPAFGGTGGEHDVQDSWRLVQFIRHLPKITDKELAEMEKLNPRAAADQPAEARPSAPPPHAHTHKGGKG